MPTARSAQLTGLIAIQVQLEDRTGNPARDVAIAALRRTGFADVSSDQETIVGQRILDGLVDDVLDAALSIRDELAGSRFGIACDAVEDNGPRGLSLPRARELAVRRARESQTSNVVIGRAFYRQLLRLSALSIQPLPGVDARYEVMRGSNSMSLPTLGRWVVPCDAAGRRSLIPTGSVRGGFLVLDAVPARRDVVELFDDPLLKRSVILVLAEAAVGKTHCAKKLAASLQNNRKVHFTDFEDRTIRWPSEPFLKGDGERLWIINAADEAMYRHDVKLDALREHAERCPQLTTVIFTRPDASTDELLRVFGKQQISSFALLPFEPAAAARELGLSESDEAFQRVRQTAQNITAADVALKFSELDEVVRSGAPSLHALRRALLLRRCSTPRKGREIVESPHRMLDVASRLAAIAFASGEHRFHFGEDGSTGFDVRRLFNDDDLRIARALLYTNVIESRGSSLGFWPTHLEEELAAHAIVDAYQAKPEEGPPLAPAALRNLFHNGLTLRPETHRVAVLVGEQLGTNHAAVVAMDAPLDPADAVSIFDSICSVLASQEHAPWVGDVELLHVLGTPAVEARAVERMCGCAADSELHFCLELALRHRWASCEAPAERIACDPSRSSRLRALAVYVSLGSDNTRDASPALVELVHAIDVDEADKDLCDLRAKVIQRRLEATAISPREAAELATEPAERLMDSRSELVFAIAAKMHIELARFVLDAHRNDTEAPIRPRVRRTLAVPAARCLIGSDSTEGGDAERFVFLLTQSERFAESVYGEVQERLGRDDALRRVLFARLNFSERFYVSLDDRRDAAWLIGEVTKRGEYPSAIRGLLFRATKHLLTDGDPLGDVGQALLKRDGHWAVLEAELRRPQPRLKTSREEVDETRAEQLRRMLPIERVIDRILNDKQGPTVRIHLLGDLLWGERFSGRNVVGSFDDLSDETQIRVFNSAVEALRTATPTALPNDNTFSTFLFAEGTVFQRAVLADPSWLNAVEVKRWLGIAIAGHGLGSDAKGIASLIEHCFRAAAHETRETVVDELKRRASSGYAQLGYEPAELRRDVRFQAMLAEFVLTHAQADEQRRETAMQVLAYLLEPTEGNASAAADRLVRALVQSDDEALRWTALGVWLAEQPEAARDEVLKQATNERSTRAIFATSSEHLRREAARWPLHAVGPLAVLLARHIPRTDDDQPDGFVTPEQQLAMLRDSLVSRLLAAATSNEALRPFADELERIPGYEDWAKFSSARSSLDNAIAGLRHPAPTPAQVAEVLRGKLAIVRDARDLAQWIHACLSVERDATDAALLHGDKIEKEPREPRHEKYVQALIRKELEASLARLGLPRAVLPQVWREPVEGQRDEPDFVVSVGPIHVPIEIKWSKNSEIIEGLSDQLARRYLKEKGRAHGVYFVAWCGWSTRVSETLGELRTRLLAEAERLHALDGVTLHVVVADLRHPSER